MQYLTSPSPPSHCFSSQSLSPCFQSILLSNQLWKEERAWGQMYIGSWKILCAEVKVNKNTSKMEINSCLVWVKTADWGKVVNREERHKYSQCCTALSKVNWENRRDRERESDQINPALNFTLALPTHHSLINCFDFLINCFYILFDPTHFSSVNSALQFPLAFLEAIKNRLKLVFCPNWRAPPPLL